MALKLEGNPANERDPVADANKVVDHLRSVGIIDSTYKKVLGALQNNDAFNAQLEELMQQKGLLQEGVTYTEQQQRAKAKEFTYGNDKQILELARNAIWSILTDESENGVAADNRLVVHQELVAMLEQDESERQRKFQELHQKQLQEQQRRLQPNIPALYGGQG